MKRDIKDYLHFYLGCEVARKHDDGSFEYARLRGCSDSEAEDGKIVAIIGVGLDHFHEWYVEETIPILRPLSEMTENEKVEYNMLKYVQRATPVHAIMVTVDSPDSFHYLINKNFDIFGLIDSGLAIDATTVKEKII